MAICEKCKQVLEWKDTKGCYVCVNCGVKRFNKAMQQHKQREPITFRAWIYPRPFGNIIYQYKETGCIPCKITVAYPHSRKLPGNKIV